MKNKHKEILELFTYQYGNDWKSNPFSIGDKSGATNGYALAVVPCKTNFEDHSAKTRVVYPFEKNLEKTISVEVIRKVLSNFPMVDNYDEVTENCGSCDTSGVVYVDYQYDFENYEIEADCPVCNGIGQETTRSKIPNGTKSINYHLLFMIDDIAFHVERIEELIQAADILGAGHIEVVHKSDNMLGFNIGDVDVLSMASTYYQDENIGVSISL